MGKILRDDAATGSRQLRDTLERHLRPSDLPAAKRGPRGAIGRMMEKAQRFAPGAGKKYHLKADSEYEEAVVAGNSERAVPVPEEPGSAGEAGAHR